MWVRIPPSARAKKVGSVPTFFVVVGKMSRPCHRRRSLALGNSSSEDIRGLALHGGQDVAVRLQGDADIGVDQALARASSPHSFAAWSPARSARPRRQASEPCTGPR